MFCSRDYENMKFSIILDKFVTLEYMLEKGKALLKKK